MKANSFFAPFITAFDTKHYRVITQHIIPLFERRLTKVLAIRGTSLDCNESFPVSFPLTFFLYRYLPAGQMKRF
jgi:hypothetical protein